MKKKISIIVILAIAVIAVAFGSIGYQQHVEAANRAAVQKKENKVKKQVEALYLDPTEKKLAKQLTKEQINKANHALSSLSNKQLKKQLQVKIDDVKDMYAAEQSITTLLDSKSVLKNKVSDVQFKKVKQLIDQVHSSKKVFKQSLHKRYQAAEKQYKQIEQLKITIQKASTKSNVDYKKYTQQVKTVSNKQAKQALNKSLKALKKKIDHYQAEQLKKEQIAKEKEAQQQVASSKQQVVTSTPSSQNGDNSSNAGSGARNSNSSTPKGGSSNTTSKGTSKPSSGKNNSNQGSVNDFVKDWNKGAYNPTGSGEIDKGGNTYIEYGK
ncbi:hypothetical protein [Listeria monocytogenes]|uniref:hypothetical protein n=1 Tax=Listeria monocytogenes TaxID=1639 RepID=UPI0010B26724|nr:hypothetical protein [Listeria monocytogenes]HBN5068629.1 hypothetical protein [Listeria innocua]EAD2781090.1 hypothetical protein [Listeria monocytogenes]EAD4818677.1 hypothetical protein [Listeria monocytogenes]EAE2608899.1 hypothetical protein [Listeria monocytogenes]EAE4446530.1 hypothetical protein [Listeria monocytogenes]